MSLNAGSYSGKVTLEHLTAPDAHVQDASQISWKGLSWTKDSNGKSYQSAKTTTTTNASNGKISVTIPDSSAVLITLG